MAIVAYSSSLNVGGEIDLVGQLRDVHLEPLLHLVQGLGVRLVADKGDSQTLGTKPAEISMSENSNHIKDLARINIPHLELKVIIESSSAVND